MSLERILRTLESFGLSPFESKVYIYLAKTGPCKAGQLAHGLCMPERQVNTALNGLEKKGVAITRLNYDKLFCAISFEELLDLLIRLGQEKTKFVEETKQDLVNSWRETIQKNT
jgi:sugar-specific transcriptional regulator TrmB